MMLNVVSRRMVPDLETRQMKLMDKNFMNLVLEIVSFIKDDLSWLTSLSTKQYFCWKVIATCCSKMMVYKGDLEWAYSYSSFLTTSELGHVYRSFCKSKNLLFGQCLIHTGLPHEVQTHPSKDLLR